GAGTAASSPLVPALVLVLLAYFGLLEGGAAVGFALAARDRAGASRSRLATAAVATGLFGLALLVLLGSSVVTTPGSASSTVVNLVVRAIALFSAVGYLAAFAPPPALRRLSQQAIVYEYIRELNALPSG